MKKLIIGLLLLPLLTKAQETNAALTDTSQGILWTEGLNWEQIKQIAKAEKKYIFVDCYATWCKPCKEMDKEVYPLKIVGNAMKEKFIAVKVQFDSSAKDAEHIRQLFSAARQLEKEYGIIGFPTYLFFTPDGEAVHKDVGQKNTKDFVRMLSDATNPGMQLFTLVKDVREGKLDYNIVPVFLNRLNESGDKKAALELAKIYMKGYLETLPDIELISKTNLQFMTKFVKMIMSNDKLYDISYRNPKTIDSMWGEVGVANWFVINILNNEFVSPVVQKGKQSNKEPDWKALHKTLSNISDEKFANDMVFRSQHSWYLAMGDWNKACAYEIVIFQRMDLAKLTEENVSDALNSIAWKLFLYSTDPKQLKQALNWINEGLALDEKNNYYMQPAHMDTKANLLYKLGRKKEAIELQGKAIALLKNRDTKRAYHVTLEKMKRGEPTWKVGENKKLK